MSHIQWINVSYKCYIKVKKIKTKLEKLALHQQT